MILQCERLRRCSTIQKIKKRRTRLQPQQSHIFPLQPSVIGVCACALTCRSFAQNAQRNTIKNIFLHNYVYYRSDMECFIVCPPNKWYFDKVADGISVSLGIRNERLLGFRVDRSTFAVYARHVARAALFTECNWQNIKMRFIFSVWPCIVPKNAVRPSEIQSGVGKDVANLLQYRKQRFADSECVHISGFCDDKRRILITVKLCGACPMGLQSAHTYGIVFRSARSVGRGQLHIRVYCYPVLNGRTHFSICALPNYSVSCEDTHMGLIYIK